MFLCIKVIKKVLNTLGGHALAASLYNKFLNFRKDCFMIDTIDYFTTSKRKIGLIMKINIETTGICLLDCGTVFQTGYHFLLR